MIFSNHSCDPNIGVRGQIVFVALRPIAAGEELTHVAAEQLREKIGRGKDLQRKYRGNFSWYPQQKIERAGTLSADDL